MRSSVAPALELGLSPITEISKNCVNVVRLERKMQLVPSDSTG